MYQNGRRVKGYSKKRLHKKKMKDKFAKTWFYGAGLCSWNYLKTTYGTEDNYHPLDYWKIYYRSGSRKYAKFCTKRKLRQLEKKRTNQIYKFDIDEIDTLPRNNEYQKYHDYEWDVW